MTTDSQIMDSCTHRIQFEDKGLRYTAHVSKDGALITTSRGRLTITNGETSLKWSREKRIGVVPLRLIYEMHAQLVQGGV